MKDQPTDLDVSALADTLAAWAVAPASLTYTPVGFGDHHWTALDADGRRWFVTVADLAHKPYCGEGVEAAWEGLRRAMDTAASLSAEAGLDFVVAPLRTSGAGTGAGTGPGTGPGTASGAEAGMGAGPGSEAGAGAGAGETVRRLGDRYAVSVFPHLDLPAGHFGQVLPPERRRTLVERLAALHRTPPPDATPVHRPGLPDRAPLDAALRAPHDAFTPEHGPYAERCRALLADSAVRLRLRQRLAEFDERTERLIRRAPATVVTHGEPHPGNVMDPGGRTLLLDWDTVALAVPERDLWLCAPDPDDLARYEELTGHHPDRELLAHYALRWDFDDVAACLDVFRAPHAATEDAEQAWQGLTGAVERLSRG
ncbi:aminoglycoside phosphotransferase family protein [Streptomyces sp. NBC_00654]|uniref:phosphotransferase family protein n=1 Tax=Streptomyces sp. NBC_00654 TaxID=2975799 RepID=UPI0022511DE1|nr:aminoglycoside phosphotransferase family protein [Streptomyces sp. NBC_00654]MCX4969607.1 aminoglycoside phosphotransferase family protein [Streptomyces sp. NBC_00654]